VEPTIPPAPEQDPNDKQAFIEAHMARAKAEDERWKTMSTADMFAQLDALSDKHRRSAAESAWERRQQQAAPPPVPLASTPPALPAPLPSYRTTVADLADMRTQTSHPTWFQAAYVDLAERLIRVETQLEDQATTLSLLHGKVEDILAYLIGREGEASPKEAV
jgi:hypothetical protein